MSRCGRRITGAAGLFFGLFVPYGGFAESVAIAIVGGALFISVARAFFAIRNGDVMKHREWMLRAFALGLGISTVRLVAAALDLSGLHAARGRCSSPPSGSAGSSRWRLRRRGSGTRG